MALKRWVEGCVVAGVLACNAPVWAFSSYHLGNSLTSDSRPHWMNGFAQQLGYAQHTWGWNDISGRSLNYIEAYPDGKPGASDQVYTESPYGNYLNALPNYHWDAVTLQPYNGANASGTNPTIAGEISAAVNMINLARTNSSNANTKFYLLGAWPYLPNYISSTDNDDYLTAWDKPVADNTNQYMWVGRSRQLYEVMLKHVREETNDAQVYIIPTGEVLYELTNRIKQGQISGLSSIDEIYRDTVHLTYSSAPGSTGVGIGRYIAATTMFSTLYGVSPDGLIDPEYANLDPVLRAQLNDVVWDVVSSYQYAGVPEPTSMVCVLTAGTMLLIRRRRRNENLSHQ